MSRASLYTRYKPMAMKIASEFFIPGQDTEDVRQEAMIGLWIATEGYDEQKGPFGPFAKVVIRRRLIEAVRQARAMKHAILTEATRDQPLPVTENETGQLQLILEMLPRLSELERASLARSLNGLPIKDKSADNALQRARRKLAAA